MENLYGIRYINKEDKIVIYEDNILTIEKAKEKLNILKNQNITSREFEIVYKIYYEWRVINPVYQTYVNGLKLVEHSSISNCLSYVKKYSEKYPTREIKIFNKHVNLTKWILRT